ncbi:peroxiredoxin [Thermodesulfovibrio hydrogeniphilus]
MLKVGDKAIEFCLQGIDENGNEGIFCLKELLSTFLILYFYPKDNTSGCSQEAMDFRDNMEVFNSNRIKVVGISPDSLASHKKFKEKFGLNFILLSDPDKEVAKAYGAYGKKKMYGKEVEGIIRSTFLIKPDSTILKAWYNVKAKGHVESIIKELKAEGFIS